MLSVFQVFEPFSCVYYFSPHVYIGSNNLISLRNPESQNASYISKVEA